MYCFHGRTKAAFWMPWAGEYVLGDVPECILGGLPAPIDLFKSVCPGPKGRPHASSGPVLMASADAALQSAAGRSSSGMRIARGRTWQVPKGGYRMPASPLAPPATDYKEPALRQYLYGHRGAPASMGTPNKGSGSSGGVATGVEDMVFVDGERIEIAGTYPSVEAAIGALHRGD